MVEVTKHLTLWDWALPLAVLFEPKHRLVIIDILCFEITIEWGAGGV